MSNLRLHGKLPILNTRHDIKMKTIAVLTSGGDAPGMNACIRAVVLCAKANGLKVIGYHHGYQGLLDQEYSELNELDVDHIIHRGGTILRTARCHAFHEHESAIKAAQNLNALNIDGLVIIGGDGSFRGAVHLSNHWNGSIIGCPGTIDNDIDGTDATIGYYTAIDTALNAIDKVRDTAEAFDRVFLVEVMGRHSGFIALSCAVGSGAEHVLVPELDENLSIHELANQVKSIKQKPTGTSTVIIVAENIWPKGVHHLSEELQEKTGFECRPVVLGHVQRGGSPVSLDRILATEMGVFAVESLLAGETGKMVGEINHAMTLYPLEKTGNKTKRLDEYLLHTQRLIN